MKTLQQAGSLLALVLILSACSSPAAKINQVRVGMSKAELTTLLGAPRETTAVGDRETLLYRLTRYRPPLKVPIKEEYQVILMSGQVAAFGNPKDLARALPQGPTKEEKTINLNVHTTSTNAVPPVQPTIEIGK